MGGGEQEKRVQVYAYLSNEALLEAVRVPLRSLSS